MRAIRAEASPNDHDMRPLYRRIGDGGKAREHLTTANAMYREMDMGFWLEKADAAGGGGDP